MTESIQRSVAAARGLHQPERKATSEKEASLAYGPAAGDGANMTAPAGAPSLAGDLLRDPTPPTPTGRGWMKWYAAALLAGRSA